MEARRTGQTLVAIGVIGLVLVIIVALFVPWGRRTGWSSWGGWGWMGPMHEWMHGRSGPPAAPPEPVPGSREIRITAKEFSFDPNRVEVSRDETVTVVLVNEGRLPHDLTIPATGVSVPVLAGSTVRAGIRVSTPGTWEFYCSVPGHREAGQTGLVVVS